MTRIGLISDTHGFLDETVFEHFSNCDEIWNAGDFGDEEVAKRVKEKKKLKGVYGNIDGNDIRTPRPGPCSTNQGGGVIMTSGPRPVLSIKTNLFRPSISSSVR